jgi:hypothetical protein
LLLAGPSRAAGQGSPAAGVCNLLKKRAKGRAAITTGGRAREASKSAPPGESTVPQRSLDQPFPRRVTWVCDSASHPGASLDS